MKTKPILFSTLMVKSILDGSKVQTRRIIKDPKIDNPDVVFSSKLDNGIFVFARMWRGHHVETYHAKVKAEIGDIFWVRETFAKMFDVYEELVGNPKEDMGYWYRADGEIKDAPGSIDKWKPSIFMPKSACRIFLEVTNIRIERLQDISEKDAKEEGVMRIWNHLGLPYEHYLNYLEVKSFDLNKDSILKTACHTAKNSFISLWQSINGKKSWKENPYVFVYDFKRVERPNNFI